jgi:dTDP-4-amino-4,6-dideoxygalactose transaminase
VLAAVGLAQLPTLAARVAARRAVFERYREALGGLPGLRLMPEPGWGRSSRWLSVALFDPRRAGADREEVRLALAAAGIESRPVWKPCTCSRPSAAPRRPGVRWRRRCSSRGCACPQAATWPRRSRRG